MVTFKEDEPAGMITVAATGATVRLLERSDIALPPDGAAKGMTTFNVAFPPPIACGLGLVLTLVMGG
jgi:hypothetical protein